uniref:Uncharacterized protein n=1 Tax=Hyaloperonospora arabidopsidis (strain Emoy2) TaxID=559515 RepID=M4BHU3_HYAAE
MVERFLLTQTEVVNPRINIIRGTPNLKREHGTEENTMSPVTFNTYSLSNTRVRIVQSGQPLALPLFRRLQSYRMTRNRVMRRRAFFRRANISVSASRL